MASSFLSRRNKWHQNNDVDGYSLISISELSSSTKRSLWYARNLGCMGSKLDRVWIGKPYAKLKNTKRSRKKRLTSTKMRHTGTKSPLSWLDLLLLPPENSWFCCVFGFLLRVQCNGYGNLIVCVWCIEWRLKLKSGAWSEEVAEWSRVNLEVKKL